VSRLWPLSLLSTIGELALTRRYTVSRFQDQEHPQVENQAIAESWSWVVIWEGRLSTASAFTHATFRHSRSLSLCRGARWPASVVSLSSKCVTPR
jgi:hypothetical protein